MNRDERLALADDLVERCRELLEWSSTGLLNGGKGGAVRALADRLREKVGETYALSLAESQTKDEAMREVVRLAALRQSSERDAVVEECMAVVGNMRQSEAGMFDEKHSGQRGEDRSNALYDVYCALRALKGAKP